MAPSAARSLLELPTEVRLRIYHFLFTSSHHVRLTADGIALAPLPLSAQVLRCRKSVHAEAISVLFALQVFAMGSMTFMYDARLLSSLSHGRARDWIQSIEALHHFRSFWHETEFFGENLVADLCKMPNLRNVKYYLDLGRFQVGDTCANVLQTLREHHSTCSFAAPLLTQHSKKLNLIADVSFTKEFGPTVLFRRQVRFRFKIMCGTNADTSILVGKISHIEANFRYSWSWMSEKEFNELGSRSLALNVLNS